MNECTPSSSILLTDIFAGFSFKVTDPNTRKLLQKTKGIITITILLLTQRQGLSSAFLTPLRKPFVPSDTA